MLPQQRARQWAGTSRRSKDAVEFIVEETALREANDLKTNTTYLSVIGVVSPMIGLTGTVWGMIGAFKALGDNGIANPSLLAVKSARCSWPPCRACSSRCLRSFSSTSCARAARARSFTPSRRSTACWTTSLTRAFRGAHWRKFWHRPVVEVARDAFQCFAKGFAQRHHQLPLVQRAHHRRHHAVSELPYGARLGHLRLTVFPAMASATVKRQRKRKRVDTDGDPEFQVAPMVDVLLVLMLFFMASLRLKC